MTTRRPPALDTYVEGRAGIDMPYYHVTRLSQGGEELGYAHVKASSPLKALQHARTKLMAPTMIECSYVVERHQIRKKKEK